MSLADIAIVGLGIAGCAAARTLAGSGRSVVAIAPVVEAREKPGDSLSPAANPLLRELGLWEAFSDGPHRVANATFSAWGANLLAERNAIVHVEGPGHVINRPAFERLLRDALPLEIAVHDDALEGATRTNDGWMLALAGGARIEARFVLDCSGRRAVFARHVAARKRADRLVAAFAFLRGRDTDVALTRGTLIEAVADGWWYAALLPDDRMSLAFFADPGLLPRGISRDGRVWERAVRETQFVCRWLDSAGFVACDAPRLASAGTTWLAEAAGEGWAAAGDAAASFDPLSSHGLTSAVWGGRRAAQAAQAALVGDPVPLARYAKTMAEAVVNFLAQRRAIYAMERRFATHPFWHRRAAG